MQIKGIKVEWTQTFEHHCKCVVSIENDLKAEVQTKAKILPWYAMMASRYLCEYVPLFDTICFVDFVGASAQSGKT